MFNKAKHNKEYWSKKGGKYNLAKKLRYSTDPLFREKISKQHKEWIIRNPEKYKLQQEKSSARRLKTRFIVFQRDKFTCQYCGRKAPDIILHIDHINPKAKGGVNKLENYITACAECNIGKSDILLQLKV